MRFRLHSVYYVLAAITLGSLATRKPLSPPRWGDMHTKHSWNAVPENWELLGHPPNSTIIGLYVALKPYRESALIDALHEVSDPKHPRYGAHLTREQVAELVAPRPGTLELVNSWLRHHGVPSSSVSLTHGGTTLTLNGVSVIQANALLGTTYQLYRHEETNEIIVRTIGYSLPAALLALVQTVAPTTCFDSPGSHTQWQSPRERYGIAEARQGKPVPGETAPTVLSSRDDDNDDSGTRPALLRWLYSTYAYKPAPIPPTRRNELGIVGIKAEYPNPDDLTDFMGEYRSDGADATYSVVLINGGGYDPRLPGDEANLNTQYVAAMGYPTPLVYFSTGRGPWGTTDYILSFLDAIIDRRDIPQTISISFGIREKALVDEFAEHLCRIFGILGVLGVSVLSASGNFGVGRGDCVTRGGNVQFQPLFPATCPWVTAVGGTTGHTPEVAALISGGGFSNIFERPAYQQQALPPFFGHLGDQYQGMYNTTSRGIPDISAQANDLPVIVNGAQQFVSGTSGSTPIVAGIVALLNNNRISAGKPPLGFLNIWLYGNARRGLMDITDGSNPGCGTDGFDAIEGWDPVTGLGTPDFQQLLFIDDLGFLSNSKS